MSFYFAKLYRYKQILSRLCLQNIGMPLVSFITISCCCWYFIFICQMIIPVHCQSETWWERRKTTCLERYCRYVPVSLWLLHNFMVNYWYIKYRRWHFRWRSHCDQWSVWGIQGNVVAFWSCQPYVRASSGYTDCFSKICDCRYWAWWLLLCNMF